MQHPTVPPKSNASGLVRSLIIVAGIICAVITVLRLAGLDTSNIIEFIILTILVTRPNQDDGATRSGKQDDDDGQQSS